MALQLRRLLLLRGRGPPLLLRGRPVRSRAATTSAAPPEMHPAHKASPKAKPKPASSSSASSSPPSAGNGGAAPPKDGPGSAVATSAQREQAVSTTVRQVVETTKKTFYGGIVVVGVAVLGVIGYVTYTQLVSADGPYRLFSKTATLLQHNAQVVHLLGAPVRVNANGPGRTVRYDYVDVDGGPGLSMRMTVTGSHGHGVATVTFKETAGGHYVCHDLVVDSVAQSHPQRVVLVYQGHAL